MRTYSVHCVGILIGGMIVAVFVPAVALAAKPRPLPITHIKDQPAREWEVDFTKEIPAKTHTVHVQRSGGSVGVANLANALQGSDITVTEKPGSVEHSRKLVTAKLLATNAVGIFLQTDSESFWQRRDTLRPVDADYVKSVEHPKRPAVKAKAAALEYRTWSDWSGKFHVEAAFVDKQGDDVTLEKKDGTRVKMSIVKLSDDDIDWIQRR